MELKYYLRSARQTISSLQQISNIKRNDLKTIANIPSSNGSDTVFLLGSGPSINSITENQFQKIRENASVGFNFWAVHPFVPSLYALQAAPRPSADQMMADIFLKRQEDYRDVNFIIRGNRFNDGTYFSSQVHQATKDIGHNYYSGEIYLHSHLTIKASIFCQALRTFGAWGPGKPRSFSPKFGATITYLIPLAAQLGFRNIVLCGIDMNDSGHFYDAFNSAEYSYPIPLPSKAATHPHVTSRGRSVLDHIVDLEQYMRTLGINIWNASASSRLAGHIPSYSWS